jgi:hypothetical protein
MSWTDEVFGKGNAERLLTDEFTCVTLLAYSRHAASLPGWFRVAGR